jgi:hypothetical protein
MLMNDTLKAILRLLEEGSPEVQIAAAQVIGQLRPAEPAVTQALAARLERGDSYLTRFLLDALANIGSSSAARVLVGRLRKGGNEADQAAHLLSRVQAATPSVLAAAFEDGDIEQKTRIIAILARGTTKDALSILGRSLLSPDSALASAAVQALSTAARDLPDKSREQLANDIGKALAKPSVSEHVVAQGLRALGLLKGEGMRATLLKHAGPRNPPVVRQAALQAMAGLPLTKTQAESLLGYVLDPDMTYVARPAIEVLNGSDGWSAAAQQKLRRLLESEQEEVRLFALRGLRACSTEAMARICIPFLKDSNPAFQQAAAEALAANLHSVDLLMKAFTSEKNVELARRYGAALAKLGKHFKAAHIEALAERAAKQVAAGEQLGDLTLQVIAVGSPVKGMAELVDKCVRLRRARKPQEALAILARAAQVTTLSPEGQYQLAISRLLLDHVRRNMAAEPGDAAMGYFTNLIREGFPLLERVRREPALSPEHLLRLGTHFAEGVGPERRFGAELLRHLAEKHSRAKAGEEAKLLLRAENL